MMKNNIPLKKELIRKSIHILSLFYPITYYYTNNKDTVITLLIISNLIVLFIELLRKNSDLLKNIFQNIFSNILRNYERKSLLGTSYLVISFLIVVLLADKDIAIISMIVLSISDALAALFGTKYGKIKIIHNKTIEGFFTFFITSYILITIMNFDITMVKIILFSFFISMVELVTPSQYDNFTVPIFTFILLSIGGIS